jgi:hypothetical protein
MYWQSAPVTTSVTVYGLGGLMLAPTNAGYDAKTTATALTTSDFKDQLDATKTIPKSVLVSIDAGYLNSPLHMECVINKGTYTGTIIAKVWYVGLGYDIAGPNPTARYIYNYASPMTLPTDGTGFLEFPKVQAENIFYEKYDAGHPMELFFTNGNNAGKPCYPTPFQVNAIVIGFEFSGGTTFGVYDISITFKLQGDTG